MWPVRPSWDGRRDFIEGHSCLSTLHVAGGMLYEMDLSWQYHLRCLLVVVILTLFSLRGLQHVDIYTLHTVGLPVVADQSLSKSCLGVSMGGCLRVVTLPGQASGHACIPWAIPCAALRFSQSSLYTRTYSWSGAPFFTATS